jgi:hypothetical protein
MPYRALPRSDTIDAASQNVKCKHGEAGKNIGQQFAGQPRQRRGQCECSYGCRQCDGIDGKAVSPQQQTDNPDCSNGLKEHDRLEVKRPSRG